jgi:CMP-N-acetylneuraminic acid synthetase
MATSSAASKAPGVLAIIPAREGSKRLPRKNLRPLGGLPLIAWSIRAAREAGVEEVMVTTDSPEIAEVSRNAGAAVPFLRPPELATDTASTFDAVRHAVDFYREQMGRTFEFVLLLQPTSPLRGGEDIEAALRLQGETASDAVISVCETGHSPLWSNTLPPDRSLEGFLGEDAARRSQDLPTYYRLNGAIYLCRTERLLREKTFFFLNRIHAHVMPRERSVDIDTELDFAFAECLLARKSAAGA